MNILMTKKNLRMMADNKIFVECKFANPCDEVFAFYTTRHGGYGNGSYAGLNCTDYCGDDLAVVEKNRSLLLETLPCRVDSLVMPRQTHGNKVLVVDGGFMEKDAEERRNLLYGVDALVGNCRNVCLAVSTADCVPVLLYSPKGMIAAVHAGWRGTVSRIVCNALEVMKRDFSCNPENIYAYIGPSISLQAFEVGDEVWEEFAAAGFDMEKISCKKTETGKWHIDLWKANAMLMESSGLLPENISCSGVCTWSNCNDVFSARRLGINSGRILSGIILR